MKSILHVSARVAVEFVSEVARARVVPVEIFAQAVAARTIVALVDVDASAPVFRLLESIVAEANEASQGVLLSIIYQRSGIRDPFPNPDSEMLKLSIPFSKLGLSHFNPNP